MQTVKLDFPDKDLYILKDGDWRGYRSTPCAKEPETVEWIRSFDEGSVLWDVGASVGPYTLIAAALGHTVCAFEPFGPSYGHLVQNIWSNKYLVPTFKVMAIPAALDFKTGIAQFYAVQPFAGTASHGEGSYLHYVQTWTADDFQKEMDPNPSPEHIKIDVDGGELAVISGGRETWKHVKSIMVESQLPTIDDITAILMDAGLELVDSWKRLGDTKQHNYLFRRA